MPTTIIDHILLKLFILLLKAWWRKAPLFPSWYSHRPISQLDDCLHFSSFIPSSNNMPPFMVTHKILWISLGTMVISIIGRWKVLILSDHLYIMIMINSMSTQIYGVWRSHPIPKWYNTSISSSIILFFNTWHFFQLQEIKSGSMRNWQHYKQKSKCTH